MAEDGKFSGDAIWVRIPKGKARCPEGHVLEGRDGHLFIGKCDLGPLGEADAWDGNEATVFDRMAEALEEYAVARESET